MVNKALDNREGDAIPPERAAVPQSVDGGDGVSRPEQVSRPVKRSGRHHRTTAIKESALDSRGDRERPGEDAFKPVPQSVDGPEAPAELLEPRGESHNA